MGFILQKKVHGVTSSFVTSSGSMRYSIQLTSFPLRYDLQGRALKSYQLNLKFAFSVHTGRAKELLALKLCSSGSLVYLGTWWRTYGHLQHVSQHK